MQSKPKKDPGNETLGSGEPGGASSRRHCSQVFSQLQYCLGAMKVCPQTLRTVALCRTSQERDPSLRSQLCFWAPASPQLDLTVPGCPCACSTAEVSHTPGSPGESLQTPVIHLATPPPHTHLPSREHPGSPHGLRRFPRGRSQTRAAAPPGSGPAGCHGVT